MPQLKLQNTQKKTNCHDTGFSNDYGYVSKGTGNKIKISLYQNFKYLHIKGYYIT